MENGICNITQIVYATVTFKLIISSFSSAYIAHISAPTLNEGNSVTKVIGPSF